uniref:Uncharacterized protein n=1 Tax=Anopheles coluzzii TaxID=1518534 RepID=A0A8W7PCG3_ANOCL
LHDALAKIDTLEQALAAHELEAERMNQQMDELRQSLEEKTIELNVMTANVSVLQEKLKTSGPKPLFPRSADEELETEAAKLRQQLDESNKNMIKCKLKIKQLQKQVDTFKKTSSVHETVAKLTEENALLVQRLAEAEERAPDSAGSAYDGAGKSVGPELQKRIEMLELTCQNQATAMQLLEEQKNDLSEDLNRTRTELQSLAGQPTADAGDGADLGDNGRIASQMLSIELEEKLEKCLADKTELTRVLHSWEAEKSELLQRLKGYADENAELLGRIDKLSLEKVSSAESIEILENLTQREKQEMENSEKRGTTAEGGDAAAAVADGDGAPDGDGTDGKPSSKEDLNESLLKLMEESKELMDKVELFTDERREVLEKLDAISIENQAYICELDKLKEANEQLRTYSGELASAKSDLEDRLRIMNDEKESIRQELATVRDSSVVPVPAAAAAGGAPTEAAAGFDQTVYQQSLVAVETEIANYNKNKDKQKKMQLAKKLTQKYHMEAECAGQRDEVAKLTEQLAAARDELCVKAGAAESLQAELDRCRGEMQTLQDELANKSGKIEKCKVIIKEKIKEAQRLLEWERRAAYLEDELRMTQSNLEDFHNQTLLLGRLKSEKEELNATVRAEHEQCKRLEDRLAELQEELTVANDRDSRMAEQLRHTERWIEQYREKWSRRANDPTVDSPLEEPPKDVFGWLALLVETDQLVTQTLAEKVNAVRALEARVQETDERTGQLTGEIERLQAELETARSERSQCRLEREQEMERLAQQLATVRTDLERAVADRGALESQQTELLEARDEIERLRADLDAGHEAFEQHRQSAVEREHNIEQLNERLVATQEQLQQALEARKELEESHRCELIELRKLLETAQQERLAAEQHLSEANESNAELGEECVTLRTNVAALEQQLGEERDTIQRLTAANEALRGQLTQLQDSLSVATQGTGWIEAQCEQLRKDHETTQAALADEKRQKEQLNEALKQRDQELDLLRRESDELRVRQSEQQSQELDDLKQQLHELDQARASLQTSLDEQRAQCEEQTRELAQLRDTVASLERQTHEDRTNISILTSLNGALNEDLDLLQQQTGEAEQRYQTLLDQCEQKQRALQTVEADLQRQTEAADQRYEQLSGEFEQKCRALEAAEQTLAQEMARKEQLSSALDTKERECAELQRTLEESQASPAGQPEAPKPEPELGMWDDAGWGMGDTARLEETIREKSELIQQLEAEKELMQQEITDLKVKSGKLLRKVKECKKVVELEREKEALAVKLELLESACEKLTELELELRNLLQERDTLQLRLSNALRMHEEYKMRLAGPIPGEQEYGTSGECSIDASPDRSLGSLPVDERPISSLSGPQDLTSKLSELQSISYSKEKRWQEEREERDRQLTLIQRDLANMPVEAAAKIAGTDVTDATAPQQSASTVLLNWILGKK